MKNVRCYFFAVLLLAACQSSNKKQNADAQTGSFATLDISVQAPCERVWHVFTDSSYAKVLGAEFDEGAYMDSDWQLGSDVDFVYEPNRVVATGTITKRIENEAIQIDYDFDGFAYGENIKMIRQQEYCLLRIYAGPYIENYDAHEEAWKNWMQKMKELSEASEVHSSE